MITAAQALSMPRFEFIAHWLVTLTRKKENLGPLGYRVRHARGMYSVVSPVGGGTVVYATKDPALLFDYARRGQLGTLVKDADEFRVLAFVDADARRARPWTEEGLAKKTERDQIERDIRTLSKGDP